MTAPSLFSWVFDCFNPKDAPCRMPYEFFFFVFIMRCLCRVTALERFVHSAFVRGGGGGHAFCAFADFHRAFFGSSL